MTQINPEKYEVFICASPAPFPLSFATHPWFVINKKSSVSRYEVFFYPYPKTHSVGHLHINFYPLPFQGIEIIPFLKKPLWKSRIIGHIEGDLAQKMISIIESTETNYPYNHRYSFTGPNSNTYVQWVLNQFPSCAVTLPFNSFGKKYLRDR